MKAPRPCIYCGRLVTSQSTLRNSYYVCNKCKRDKKLAKRRLAGLPRQAYTTKKGKRTSANAKRRLKELRRQAIVALGARCMCPSGVCLEERPEFLEIDHINGGGNVERKELRRLEYLKLVLVLGSVKYRLLCSNCNHSLGVYGYCPHSKEAEKLL